MNRRPSISQRLTNAPAWVFSVYAIFAAFTTYACMYGYRKAFGAGSYETPFSIFGKDFALKSALVISQVIGYALSKYLGIKINSEMPHAKRAMALIACIGMSQMALLAFGVLPPWGKVFAIFFSGLPLGMVWGLVFSFLEGRKLTELLGAGLCCAFILASGFAKTVGAQLMVWGIPETWMPATAGLCYLPFFLLAVWLLCQLPEPTPEDERLRVHREPMDHQARMAFLKHYFPGLALGFVAYVGLTVFRDYRDNFAKEIFKELGIENNVAIFTQTEVPIALAVLALVGLLFLVKDNRRGFFLTHVCALAGAILVGIATWLFDLQLINGVFWMIFSGFGAFLAYVPFNCIFYDRMIAALGTVATAVFCITVADALGYTGVIGVMIFEQYQDNISSKVTFVRAVAYTVSALSTVCIAGSWVYFSKKTKAAH